MIGSVVGRRHRVAVLVRDGMLPIELGIVHRIFGQARSQAEEPLYDVLTCTTTPGIVRTDTDISVNVDCGPEILKDADTVVFTASDQDYEPHHDTTLSENLRAALALIRPDARIATICTAAFILAAAGFLDGLRATTHWRSTDDLQRLYPKIHVDPDVLYTDEGRVLTSAGVASGLDLCLHMVRCDYGEAVANDVARGTVVSPHRQGGQAQFIKRPIPEPQSSSTACARAWALENLDHPISLQDLAERESVSSRTFTRRFRDETGESPLQWLKGQRLARARELLEETDLTIDQVAARAGFGTTASLRQHLKATLKVSPAAYRQTFRSSS